MNRPRGRVPLGVSLGLITAILLDTLVQLCWKASVVHAGENTSLLDTFRIIAFQPMTYVLCGLFLLQFVNWMIILSKADLSFAQPITAASYVLTCVGSSVLFHDPLPFQRWAGIGLILAGVWFVTRSGHRTTHSSSVPGAA